MQWSATNINVHGPQGQSNESGKYRGCKTCRAAYKNDRVWTSFVHEVFVSWEVKRGILGLLCQAFAVSNSNRLCLCKELQGEC